MKRWQKASLATALLVLSIGSCRAYEPPKPNPYLAKRLAETGISEAEWLLFEGIRKASEEQIRYALKAGADPNNAKDSLGTTFTPLIAAIVKHRPDLSVIDLLLEHGADVNARYAPEPFKPADATVESRIFAMITNSASGQGKTPLHFAAGHSTPEVIRFLISRGAQLEAKDVWGHTPLFAVRPGQIQNAEALLEAGADINARDTGGRTLLGFHRFSVRYMQDTPEHHRRALRDYIDCLFEKGAAE